MMFSGIEDSILELSPAVYEFPGSHGVASIWLLITVCASTAEGAWRPRTYPCLVTRKLRELADWLGALSHREMVEPGLEFIEPELRFSWTRMVE